MGKLFEKSTDDLAVGYFVGVDGLYTYDEDHDTSAPRCV